MRVKGWGAGLSVHKTAHEPVDLLLGTLQVVVDHDMVEARRKGKLVGSLAHALDEFRQRVAADEFLECEEVYEGRFYGTLKSQVDTQTQRGENVLFDVDVKGWSSGCAAMSHCTRVLLPEPDGAQNMMSLPGLVMIRVR